MNLKTSIEFFKALKSKTTDSIELNIYDNYINLLSELKDRHLNREDLQLIEEEIEAFTIEFEAFERVKQYDKLFFAFKRFLKEKLKLVPEGYYTTLGIALGLTIGVSFGICLALLFSQVFGSLAKVAFVIFLALTLGIVVGKVLDGRAYRAKRTLKN